MSGADRLDELEMRSAEQERTIAELSEQLAEQWKAIERLESKLAALADRHAALEDRVPGDVPITKPPHW